MPICRDPLVANLRAQGYNTLRVPRKDYLPGLLVFHQRKGGLDVFGTFEAAFHHCKGLEVSESAQAEAFSSVSTSSYRRGTAMKLASAWLGVPEAGLSVLFGSATKLSFRFGDMRVLTTPLAGITRELATAEPTPELVALPESRLFVIHEVLQAKQIFCLNEADRQGAADLNVKETLADVAHLGFDVDTTKSSLGLLVFTSREYHTIGFKAYEIELQDGELSLRRALETGFSHLSDLDTNYEPAFFEDMLI